MVRNNRLKTHVANLLSRGRLSSEPGSRFERDHQIDVVQGENSLEKVGREVVDVEVDYPVAVAGQEPMSHRRAVVGGVEGQHRHGETLGDLLRHGRGPVGRAVLDEEDPVRLADALHLLDESRNGLRDEFGLVVHGDHYREGGTHPGASVEMSMG